ncbi:hypothetical protein [Hafnia paralvei]|uniref:hypothetical protein n=1 Tax=Hafnia paralvei TaxID=546367 RepID=UPI0010345FBD|nr:hypothetical protein [Hafnia paralvei]TBL58039.1 hypothetical protein EYY97_16875 [Hafnia paralvei]
MFNFNVSFNNGHKAILLVEETSQPYSSHVYLTATSGGVFQVYENNEYSLETSGSITVPLVNGTTAVSVGSLLDGLVKFTATIGTETAELELPLYAVNDPMLVRVSNVTPENGSTISASTALSTNVSIEGAVSEPMVLSVESPFKIIDSNSGIDLGYSYEGGVVNGKFPEENIVVDTSLTENLPPKKISFSFKRSAKTYDSVVNVIYDQYGIITDIFPATGYEIIDNVFTTCLAQNHDHTPSKNELIVKVKEDGAYFKSIDGSQNFGKEYIGYADEDGRFPQKVILFTDGSSDILNVEYSFLDGGVVYPVQYKLKS